MDKSKRFTPESVDEYLTLFDGEVLKRLTEVRDLMKKTMPDAEEAISYAIPAYKINGRPVIYFAGFKNHTSIYPLPKNPDKNLAQKIKPYIAGRGTLKFKLTEPLPLALIEQVIAEKLKDFIS